MAFVRVLRRGRDRVSQSGAIGLYHHEAHLVIGVRVAWLLGLLKVGCTNTPTPQASPEPTSHPIADASVTARRGFPKPAVECAAPSVLMVVSDVLADRHHACHAWIEATHGRVLQLVVGGGSAVVWTRRTPHDGGVVVSAAHVLGETAGGGAVVETLDPQLDDDVGFVKLHGLDGRANEWVSPVFKVFDPGMPARENANAMRDVLPKNDFFVAVLGTPTILSPLASSTIEVAPRPLEFHDPHRLTLDAPTYADPRPGDRVLLVGAPHYDELHASVGRVLSDREVGDIQGRLRTLHNEEGRNEYQPDVEFWVLGRSRVGMSGGGTFDERGRLIGITVRGNSVVNDYPIVRVVRMRYVVARTRRARDALSERQRRAVDRVLGTLD